MKLWTPQTGQIDVEIEQNGELLIKVVRAGVIVRHKESGQEYEVRGSTTYQEVTTDYSYRFPDVRTVTRYKLLPIDEEGEDCSDRVPPLDGADIEEFEDV